MVYTIDLTEIPSIDELDLGFEPIGGAEFAVRFTRGVLEGIFVETPKGLVVGTVDLVKGAWSLVVNTNAAAYKYVFLLDDPESLERAGIQDREAMREAFKSAGKAGEVLFDVAWKIAELTQQADADARAASPAWPS